MTAKIYMVDDHAALRDALAGLINGFDHFEVVGVASNGAEAVAAFEGGLQTDMVLLDLSMPVMDGYDVADWLAEQRPGVKIVVLTMGVEGSRLTRLLAAGICGILNKDVGREELTLALQTIAAGGQHYSNTATKEMAVYYRKNDAVNAGLVNVQLTEAEMNFIRLSTTDLTYKEISDRMGISKNNAETIRVAVFNKLGLKNRASLAMFAVKNGMV